MVARGNPDQDGDGVSAARPANALPKLSFTSAAAFRAWLAANHKDSPGLWLMIGKQASAIDSVTYDEAVDEALCYGWIDGQKAAHDDSYFLQRFTPRTKRSPWSQVNVERAVRLAEAKRMRAVGRRAVDTAKADGRWAAAYAPQSTAAVPPDLQAALDARPKAARLFAQLDSANRYAILYRIDSVKRPETRARKIAGFIDALARGETPHPRKKRAGPQQ
ncbi:MAG: YdeI/OmpD-associated family protein [Acidimicrobiales bacterium]